MDFSSPDEVSNLELEVESRDSTPEYIPKKITKQHDPLTSKTVEEHTVPLKEYIPFGCYRIHASYLAGYATNAPSEGWTEATDFLPEVSDPDVPWKALVDLWRAHWVRILCSATSGNNEWTIWRIFILPDDVARRAIDRDSNKLRKALGQVLGSLDVAPQTWNGDATDESAIKFDPWAAGEDRSLFYMFNTLPSPAPSLDVVKDSFAQTAMHEILGSEGHLRGLKTTLYPYQRRSVAMMLQREVAPHLQLDPRLESRTAPTGTPFFYGARDHILLRNPRFYDSVRGGILAETMGLGKTLMCIALVLATRGHWPKVPVRYSMPAPPLRSRVASLAEISAAAVARNGIPWRKVFDDMKYNDGVEMDECTKLLESQVPMYEIPPRVIRSNRSSTFSTSPEQVRLCMGTIIVVPQNLVHQWQSELSKHTKKDALNILVMTNSKDMLPWSSELATYDIVLFSRTRFESEAKKMAALDIDYQSPLKDLHWLRIIIDEGHNFSSSTTNASVVADRLVRAERRWIVSGTPAKDLLGVEVEMNVMTYEGEHDDGLTFRQQSLEQRKKFNSYLEDSSGAVKSLGALASNFLKAEPWTGAVGSEDLAKWDDYIYRHEGYQTKTHTCFSTCFRQTLENLVIKTRPEDIERDIGLPSLSHKIVRLEPSFFDKLTANLFVLAFTSNAVTSERTDVDYLFHKGSSKHLHRLIDSLRQSGFYWTGFKAEHVAETVKVTNRYLEKKDTTCSQVDRDLLVACLKSATVALDSPYWTALSTTEEMGLFVGDWPEKAKEAWALEECVSPDMMIGLTQSVAAQKYINNTLSCEKPGKGLANAGIELKAEKEQAASDGANATVKKVADIKRMEKNGVPSINFHTDKTRLSASGVTNAKSPRKSPKTPTGGARMHPEDEIGARENPKRGTKRRMSVADSTIDLNQSSKLGRTRVDGTASKKFSYLIDRILDLHTDEKILVFFDANYQAYYLSQALDLFSIKHLIYAGTLTSDQRGKYIVLFNTDPGHRVLLMDIKQAAHGLNLSSASRVFFINPVCRPGIEAQAIKRAHRIGQTRPVYVETLVLKDTVEEAMHDRSTAMTRHEHIQASKFLEDDATITRIIQNAKLLDLHENECSGHGQMAALRVPQQIFGRPGRGGGAATGLERELFGDKGVEDEADAEEESIRPKKKARTVKFKSRKIGKTEETSRAQTDGRNGDDDDDDDVAGSSVGLTAAAVSSPAANGYTSIFGGY